MKKYRDHAANSLITKANNDINQQGKSNIEPISYVQNIIEWYQKLLMLLDNDPPSYYIRNLVIDSNDNRDIVRYEYEYYETGEIIDDMYLIITIL